MRIFCLLVILLNAIQGYTQDPLTMQFHSNVMQLNPAFAGTAGCSRASAGYRNQWPGIFSTQGQTFVTYTASYDQHINFLNAGAGINFMHDRSGIGALKNLRISYTHSQYFKITDKMVIRPGAEITYLRKTIDENRLTFGDMIDPRRGFVYNTKESFRDVNTIDLSTGVLIHTTRFATGIAVYHLTQPNTSLFNESISRLPRKYVAHFTYLFSKDIENAKAFAFAPEALYMIQGMASSYIFGGTFKYNILRAAVKYGSNGFFIAGVGIQTAKINFGYSYDIITSKLSVGNPAGSHEVTASYLFNCRNKKDKIKTLRLINL